jgi:MYXO-CTERM domain-containing protein
MQPCTLLWLALSNAEAGTGIHTLTDASGLEYWIADDATWSTTYSASGALTDATYTTWVTASTVSGGTTTSSYMYDSFDAYGLIKIDGDSYWGNGPATFECGDRQLVYGTQAMGDLSVWRKVYVPDDDAFARMLVFLENDTKKDVSAKVGFTGNLGSDNGTTVKADSSGDAVVDLSDNWAVSMQDFSYAGTFYSSDPRLGHVWQNGFGSVVADEITLEEKNEDFHWRFTVTVPAGKTIALMTYVTGQPTIAAAEAQAIALFGMPSTATECMTKDELAQVINFGADVDCSHLDDQCNEGTYDLSAAACVATPVNEGSSCDDALACTEKDLCGAGTCAGIEAAEVPGDEIDEDCAVGEVCFADADDDGHAAKGQAVVSKDADCADAGEATATDPADDCDDDDAAAYPGATEIANDDVDQDCDGKDLVENTTDDSGGGDAGGDDAGGDDGGGDDGGSADDGDDKKGCSYASGSGTVPLSALALLGIVGLVVRRRR